MKKILTIFMSLLVALTLTACSGSSSIAGTYELKEMTTNGKTITVEDEAWKTASGGKDAIIKLNDDDSCSVDLLGQSGEGTYKVDGSTVSITIDGSTQEFELKDGQLTVEMGGIEMVFEK